MYRREINVDNIVEFLNSFNYSEEAFKVNRNHVNCFKFRDYKVVTDMMVHHFFDTYTKIELDNYDINLNFSQIPLQLCEDKIGKILKNVSKIEFTRMYPNIILNLYREGRIKFNVKEFFELYEFMVINQQDIEKHSDTVEVTKGLLRSIINMLYGASLHPETTLIRIDRPYKVIDYYKNNHIDLFNIYSCIIQTDIDVIHYLNTPNNKVEEHIKELNIPYTITHNLNGYFHQKKRYIIEDGEKIKVHGMNDPRTYKVIKENKVTEMVRNVVNQMTFDLRKRKIEKIKDGLQGQLILG